MKIKDEVRIVQSSSASNVPRTSTLPPSHSSPKSPPRINTTKESMTRKVLSPLVARRRGRPCTKRKVSKVDAIVNLLKGKNKKANPVQGCKVRQGESRKLSFPCTGGVQHTMYEPVPPNQPYYCPSMDAIEDSMYVPVSKNRSYYLPCMDATQDSIYVPAPVSTIGDDIESTSHTQAGMVNNISSQSSIVPSNFVDLNIDRDPNVPFFF